MSHSAILRDTDPAIAEGNHKMQIASISESASVLSKHTKRQMSGKLRTGDAMEAVATLVNRNRKIEQPVSTMGAGKAHAGRALHSANVGRTHSAPPSSRNPTAAEADRARRDQRREWNRANARKSRLRKKFMNDSVTVRLDLLHSQNVDMRCVVEERGWLPEYDAWVAAGADAGELLADGVAALQDARVSGIAAVERMQHALRTALGDTYATSGDMGDEACESAGVRRADPAEILAARLRTTSSAPALVVPVDNQADVHVLPNAILLIDNRPADTKAQAVRGSKPLYARMGGQMSSSHSMLTQGSNAHDSGASGSDNMDKSTAGSSESGSGLSGKRSALSSGMSIHGSMGDALRGGSQSGSGGSIGWSGGSDTNSRPSPLVGARPGVDTQGTGAVLRIPPRPVLFVGQPEVVREDSHGFLGYASDDSGSEVGPQEDELVSEDDLQLHIRHRLHAAKGAGSRRDGDYCNDGAGMGARASSTRPRLDAIQEGAESNADAYLPPGSSFAANLPRSGAGGSSRNLSPVHTPAAVVLCPSDYQLVHLVTTAQPYFVITDPMAADNPIAFSSAGFHMLTGYSRNEVLGFNCRFLQGTGTDRATVRRIGTAVLAGKDVHAIVLNYTKAGVQFWNELFIAPLRDQSGTIVHFVGVQKQVSPETAARLLRVEKYAEGAKAIAAASEYNNGGGGAEALDKKHRKGTHQKSSADTSDAAAGDIDLVLKRSTADAVHIRDKAMSAPTPR